MKKILLSLTNWDEYPRHRSFERELEVTDEEFEYLSHVQRYERGQTKSGVLDVIEVKKQN